MVTLPGILSPMTEISPEKCGIPVEDKVSIEIERVYHEMGELINPLASVRTHRQLEAELNHRAQEYLHLKNKLWSLITSKLDEAQLIPSVLQAYRDISKLIKQDDIVLSPEEQEVMLDLIDSMNDLLEAFVEGFRSDRPGLIDILLECSAPLQRVDMCSSTVMLVLLSEIIRWDKAAIKLLCHTADEYMLQVEDIFFAHDKELVERLSGSSKTISLEEVRHVIELSS